MSRGAAQIGLGRRSRRAAFTLMELVAAMLLLSIAFPPLAVSMRDAVVRQGANNQRIIARWLAHARMEEVLADRHSSTRGWPAMVTSNYTTGGFWSQFPGFSQSVTIMDHDATLIAAGTTHKLIIVTISWNDATRGSSSIRYQTVVTNY
ncbi:MAG: type II secretion system GspH family protein [Phycisphaerales bacterium]|jgi:prepilin-type N-terminal cleavage/methylation domain-containing protein|nr:type II secretion system GspH family protein [Phycisphaerales bacterium]